MWDSGIFREILREELTRGVAAVACTVLGRYKHRFSHVLPVERLGPP